VGNVDAGKSTLLGVLTHAELDNGRGYARQKLFRHKHEMESGRTSSVGNDILGFDSCGVVVNKPEHGSLDWVKICERASKVCYNTVSTLSPLSLSVTIGPKCSTYSHLIFRQCLDIVRWAAGGASGL